MKDTNQQIIKFGYDKNFKNEDFYISKSNQHIFKLIDIWPKLSFVCVIWIWAALVWEPIKEKVSLNE